MLIGKELCAHYLEVSRKVNILILSKRRLLQCVFGHLKFWLPTIQLCFSQNLRCTGVRPSYHWGHISESVTRSLKCKSQWYYFKLWTYFSDCSSGNTIHKILSKEDQEIEHQNKKIKCAFESVAATHEELERCVQSSSNLLSINRAEKKREKALTAYEKVVERSTEKIGSGFRKVGLLLPPLPDRPHSGSSAL